MTALTKPARIDLGIVLNRAFGAIGANFGTFIALAILLAAIPAMLITIGYTLLVLQPVLLNADPNDPSAAMSTILLGTFGVLFLSAIPASVLTGALTQASLVHFNGGKASIGECISTGLRFVLPLVGLGILTIIGLYLWALLLLIPAILAATRWAVAPAALVAERTGVFGAFQRSIDLTRDNRWAIFFLVLIYVVISTLLSAAVSFLTSAMQGATSPFGSDALVNPVDFSAPALWVEYGFQIVYGALSSMILGAGQAALYYELRVVKEGVTSDELAKVFD
jgi:hypothetical protein